MQVELNKHSEYLMIAGNGNSLNRYKVKGSEIKEVYTRFERVVYIGKVECFETYVKNPETGEEGWDIVYIEGVREKIELHHHSIDGRETELFMDWACTESYCQAFADTLGLKIYFSWKQGGFEAELLRDEVSTGAIAFENHNKEIIVSGGVSSSVGTRLKFPAPVASLKTRWCSAYLFCLSLFE